MTPDDYAKLRALELSEALTAAQAEIASLRSLLAVAEGALGWVEYHYANQDMKHVDFRVEAAHRVADALTAIRAAKEKTNA